MAMTRVATPAFCTTIARTFVLAEMSLDMVLSLNLGNSVADETGTDTLVPSGWVIVMDEEEIAWTVPRSIVTVTTPFFLE